MAYYSSGTWTSDAWDIDAYGALTSATISWTATTPASTTVTMETSINNGGTWQAATNGGAISGLTNGTGVLLLARATLSTSDTRVAPSLDHVDISLVTAAEEVTDPSDWYNFGPVTWLTGDNAGFVMEVDDFTNSGGNKTFELLLQMGFPIQVGDTFSVIPGCDGRFDGGCSAAKFNNRLRFGGFPEVPGPDVRNQTPNGGTEGGVG